MDYSNKKEVIAAHRELWRWLAENPGRNKNDYPGWWFNGGGLARVENGCHLCEYVSPGDGDNCFLCPVIWPNGRCEQDGQGLYDRWCDSDILAVRSKIAKQIAELPERQA